MRLTLDAAPSSLYAGDDLERGIVGLLVPYGEVGSTSIGPVRVERGAIRVPDDLSRVKLLAEHDRTSPIGYLASVTDDPDGMRGRFAVPSTPAGDVAYLEAAARVRDGLSVELADVELAPSGRVTAGRLVAVALVGVPAFTDSTAIAAADHTPDPDPDPDPDREDPTVTPTTPTTTEPPATVEPVEPVERVPAGLLAGRTEPRGPRTLADVADAFRAANTGAGSRELTAALVDLTHTANAWAQPPQYVGELWEGVAYTRQIVPFLNQAALTSYKVSGWRWTTPPEVDTYAGDKAAVPSNPAATEAVEVLAERLAGAHDIDRKFRDFGDAGFWSSYFAAMTASYARKSDDAALAALLADGTAATKPDLSTALLEAFLQVSMFGSVSKVLVSADLLAGTAALTAAEMPPFVSAFFAGMTAVELAALSHRDLPPSTVMAWDRNAATWYELPGSPIRVEAVNVPNGGIDAGVFGYYACNVHQPGAVSIVTVGAGGQQAATKASTTKATS